MKKFLLLFVLVCAICVCSSMGFSANAGSDAEQQLVVIVTRMEQQAIDAAERMEQRLNTFLAVISFGVGLFMWRLAILSISRRNIL